MATRRGPWTALTGALLALVLLAGACSDSDGGDAADGTDGSGTDTSEATTGSGDPLLVDTGSGPVQGTESDVAGVRAFLDIPFAQAPTGDLAWMPPEPVDSWEEPLDATSPGPACPQTSEGTTTAFLDTPEADPDCLSLNVWSPDDAEGLPVMVWIHGGGLSTGSAHEPYYIGDNLAAEGVVMVSMNYRLGPQGFLAVAEQADERDDGGVGNYGFLDQQAALEWVQANVAAFGGDPEAVTIFGESAGGFSVCAHLAAPGSDGLFSKAIVQSGGGCDRLGDREQAEADGQTLLAALDCEDLDCLRSKDDDEVIAAAAEAEVDTGLVSDGVVLDRSARELAAAGELDVPVLIGSNADEATLFTISLDEPSDEGLVELASSFTDDPEALVALYPADEYDSNLARYQAMSTDTGFTCPTLAFAEANPTTFVYHHTYVSAQNPLGLGATHGAEIAPLFGHPEGIVAIEIETDESSEAVGQALRDAWTAFAAEGDPGELFDVYQDAGTITLTDDPFVQVDEIRDGRCAQVNELSTRQR